MFLKKRRLWNNSCYLWATEYWLFTKSSIVPFIDSICHKKGQKQYESQKIYSYHSTDKKGCSSFSPPKSLLRSFIIQARSHCVYASTRRKCYLNAQLPLVSTILKKALPLLHFLYIYTQFHLSYFIQKPSEVHYCYVMSPRIRLHWQEI